MATGPNGETTGDGDGGGIENSGTLSVIDSTFSDNSASGASGDLSAGNGNGGAIDNSGKLSVTGSTFSGNSATGGGAIHSQCGTGSGGAIENSGTLSLTDSTFSGNSAVGGVELSSGAGDGGGIMNSGTLTVTLCAFSGNSATGSSGVFFNSSIGEGGGIGNSGTLSVTDSTFSGNSTTAILTSFGGGVENSGTLSVIDSTFSGNSALSAGNTYTTVGGGGIENSGTLSLVNSTFNNNSVAQGGVLSFGGAIADAGPASITYVTATDNSAPSDDGGGVGTTNGGVVDSIDSIFQNPKGGNVAVLAGGFQSLGYNLFSDTPGISLDPSDLVNTDPRLGPLANNGGPTLTEALLGGSPAINSGIAVPTVTTDQRGGLRPSSGATDIGAFQIQPSLTVVSLERSGSGRHPTALVLTFNLPLDPATAESLANYRLVQAANHHAIAIRSAQYNSARLSVTLRPKPRLSPGQTYVLSVIGARPPG